MVKSPEGEEVSLTEPRTPEVASTRPKTPGGGLVESTADSIGRRKTLVTQRPSSGGLRERVKELLKIASIPEGVGIEVRGKLNRFAEEYIEEHQQQYEQIEFRQNGEPTKYLHQFWTYGVTKNGDRECLGLYTVTIHETGREPSGVLDTNIVTRH